MLLSWMTGPVALVTIALPMFLYAPDKPRDVLERAYPGEYRLVDGVRLRLRDDGPRDAPALILLHGFCSSLETWEPWAKALSRHYRVIHFDLPGFGLTGPDPTGDYSDKRETKILADLMDRLGVARATLIGNSMGGRIASVFSAERPERVAGLVLVSPQGLDSSEPTKQDPSESSLARALQYFAPPPGLMRMGLNAAYGRPEALSQTNVARYRDLLLAPGVRRAILDRLEQPFSRLKLQGVQAPTLLMWGERDNVIPIRYALAYLHDLPHAEFAPLPGLGHVPFEEDPEASLAPLLRFLAGSAR